MTKSNPKIILAFDKFKGAASSEQIAQWARSGILKALPGADVRIVIVADGGEGTTRALAGVLGSREPRRVRVDAPLLNLPPVQASYVLDRGARTAVMELASASGLQLVPQGMRNPLVTSTRGTGQMILDAVRQGCRHILLGLGGSATHDCGTGLLSELGFRFLDGNGREVLPCGRNLGQIAAVDGTHVPREVRDTKFTVVCDVMTPLCGINGAARQFSRQKGAIREQEMQLEAATGMFCNLLPHEVRAMPGSGAAGGVGAGMVAFLDAHMCPGVEAVLECQDFEGMLGGATLVLTGEGCVDSGTALGKAPAGVLEAAHRHGVPVVALCGMIGEGVDVGGLGFDGVFPILSGPMSAERAIEATRAGIERTAAQIGRMLAALGFG